MDLLNVATLVATLATAPVDTLDCWDEPANWLLHPPGYSVQYVFPFYSQVPARVTAFGFLNNDEHTVWPSAGVVVIAPDSVGAYRFPTLAELQNLQLQNVPGVADTTVLRFDINTDYVEVGPDDAVAMIVEMAQDPLITVGVGAGFAAADGPQQPACSYFTEDGITWWSYEFYEWAWALEIEPVSPTDVYEPHVATRAWSAVKKIYK